MANAPDTPNQIPAFKLVLVGDRGVGKSTFARRHLSGNYEKKYIATLAAEIYPMLFWTNRAEIKFNVWDSVRTEKSGELKHSFFASVHCAIIMFDVTKANSYENVPRWYELVRTGGDVPVVLCGNKVDARDRMVEPRDIVFHRRHRPDCQYYDVSAKTNYNFEKPFLWLSRRLIGDPALTLLSLPALAPPDVQEDPALMQRYEQELEEALQQPLDDDEDVTKS